MKQLTPCVLLALFFFGCASIDRVVESDYSYDGKFSRYDSFDFMHNEEDGIDSRNQELVEKFITQRMRSLGFRQKVNKPSLIVSFRLFYDDFEIRGYAQPGFSAYVDAVDRNVRLASVNEVADEESTEYKDYFEVNPSDLTTYDEDDLDYYGIDCKMNEGSLLITFFDRKARKAVWQGYASGVVQQMNKERFLRHTVGRILDNYRVLAKDYGVSD